MIQNEFKIRRKLAAKNGSENDEDNSSEKEALKNARVRGAEFTAKKIACLEIKYVFRAIAMAWGRGVKRALTFLPVFG